MRPVNDRKLTELLDAVSNLGCQECPMFNQCDIFRVVGYGGLIPKSKRACLKQLRGWLTPGEETK